MGGWVGRGAAGQSGDLQGGGCGLCGEAPCPPTCPGMAIFLKNVTFHGILLDAPPLKKTAPCGRKCHRC